MRCRTTRLVPAVVMVAATVAASVLFPTTAAAATAGSGRQQVAAPRVLMVEGDTGARVRELQARLRRGGWFVGDVTSYYGTQTRAAVRAFQADARLAATGRVNRTTWSALTRATGKPTAGELANEVLSRTSVGLDRRCRTGRALCVDKTTLSLRWVVDGDVKMALPARFGATGTETREGLFSVYWKSRDHVSSLYGSSMPYAMFFSGGQAVHYSADFAAVGYAGGSHGCVNIRNRGALGRLFDRVREGDKVVVYRS